MRSPLKGSFLCLYRQQLRSCKDPFLLHNFSLSGNSHHDWSLTTTISQTNDLFGSILAIILIFFPFSGFYLECVVKNQNDGHGRTTQTIGLRVGGGLAPTMVDVASQTGEVVEDRILARSPLLLMEAGDNTSLHRRPRGIFYNNIPATISYENN